MEQPTLNSQIHRTASVAKPTEEAPIDNATQWVHDMTAILRENLAVQEPWASAMAYEIVEGMRARFGGDDVYVPAPDKQSRNERVREMFNGRNLKELMQVFGLSRSTVYKIVGRRGQS
jgi:Mor family transcriptional regulator